MKNLSELTYKEIKENFFEIAVLPWGSCEPHNLHLPYGIDTFTAEQIALRSAEMAIGMGAKIVVLPTIPVGVNTNTMGFPMTLNLNPTTEFQILKDIVESLEKHGISKLVIINGHGGNEFKWMLRQLHGHNRIFICAVNWWENMHMGIYDRTIENKGGEHGDETETSLAMYLVPELVRIDSADEGKVKKPKLESLKELKVAFVRPWHALTSNAGHGNPSKATPEKGKILLDMSVKKIAGFLKELSDAKIDGNFPY